MFFDSPLYDPHAPWRQEPATDRQRAALEKFGVDHHPEMTKGEAADLIGCHSTPDEEELEFLRFFRVPLCADASQYEARREIARIVAEPENRARWENRPASDEQHRLIEFVEGKVPDGLTATMAEALIASYDQDEALADRAAQFRELESFRKERDQEIASICDEISAGPSAYGLRSVSWREVREAVEQLEAASERPLLELTHENGFRERVADRVGRNHPEKVMPRQSARASSSVRRKEGSWIGAGIGLFLILSVLYYLLSR
jgi:hypothetical protein